MAERIGWIVQEFEIRLIQNDNDLVRYPRQKVVDLVFTEQCSGRVIGIRDEDDFGSRSNRVQHRLEIRLKVLVGLAWIEETSCPGPGQHDPGVGPSGIGQQHLVAWLEDRGENGRERNGAPRPWGRAQEQGSEQGERDGVALVELPEPADGDGKEQIEQRRLFS